MSVKVVKSNRSGRYLLRWKADGKWKEETTALEATSRNRRKAERLAAEREQTLKAEAIDPLAWDHFRQAYYREKLSGDSENYQVQNSTVFTRFEGAVGTPELITDVTPRDFSKFVGTLRDQGCSPNTIETYLRVLSAAFRWAVDQELIREAPRYKLPKNLRPVRRNRGRPLTDEEFDRMLEVTPIVRREDGDAWRFFLRGLWLSGLRLGEAHGLSWDAHEPFAVATDQPYPCFRVYAEAEKGRRDRLLPMAPDFAKLIGKRGKGRVFREVDVSLQRSGAIIREIGRAARVVVSPDGRTATAHDLRRSFGTRWARKLLPVELMALMRHQRIETTLTYYVEVDTADLSRKLWEVG